MLQLTNLSSMQCLGSSGGRWVTYFADPSKVCPTHQHPLLRGPKNSSMLRAARHTSTARLSILISQMLFFMKIRTLIFHLQCEIDEVVDCLHDFGFTGNVILISLDQTRDELRQFISMCDRAIMTSEGRLFDIFLRRFQF